MDSWIVAMVGIQVLFLSFLIWVTVHYRSKKSRQRTDERIRLLERFESPDELEHFLTTEAGRSYIETSGSWRFEPRWLVLVCLIGGAICLAIGVGVLLLVAGSGDAGGNAIAGSVHAQDLDDLAIPGTILASLGVGLFLAAAISWVLVRLWGLDSDRAR